MESDNKGCVFRSVEELMDMVFEMPSFEEAFGYEKRSNKASNRQVICNNLWKSKTVSNSSNNAQQVKNNKGIELNKRTRRRPRWRKAKGVVDNVSNTTPDSSLLNKITVSQPLPSTSKDFPSLPSTSKDILQSPSTSRNVSDTHEAAIRNHQLEMNNFIIGPVTGHKTGSLIRIRNFSYKYVNLKSFIKDTNKLPQIFTTKLAGIKSLSGDFKKLSVNNQKDMTKSELRKYPRNLHPNEPSLSSKSPKKKKSEKRKKKKEADNAPFPDYIDVDEVTEGLANGNLVKGFVRINPKNFKDSYVSNEDTSLADYYLTSVVDRNRALEGDEVILRVKPETEWIDGKKTATVVFITQLIHPRIAVGVLKPLEKQDSSEYAVFCPRDKRIPVLRIPAISWPNGFKNNPKQYEKILFAAKIVEWTLPSYAFGVLTENLGLSSDLKVETLAILREFCLDVTPFSPEMAEYLPKSTDIPQQEFEYREDIRKECVFTIDPPTAKDLDDAVSVKELSNGNYEIGVHISDAAFYLDEGTELDQLVSKKATTIYLVEQAYHMLPVELCLHCSLLPGQDKLSFSVFWEMTEDGDVINKRFTRSIMNSCVQLAYDHAQEIIDNPEKDFENDEFPVIHNGFSLKDIIKSIRVLQKIAVILRDRRMQNGALKIDQTKLLFHLDAKTGDPLEFWKYENKESHRLIEEFMLLANISVAERISEAFPDIAFLRCHEPPKQTMLLELQNSLATCGIHIDISSSGGIQTSLQKYITNDFPGKCRGVVLNHITAKAMTRARYFCSSVVESEENYSHYALSVPIYTHFTSPIRRYADIMVHRLLAASLDYREKPEWDVDYVCAIAANCNAQKYNAKRAGEASSELYLAHYVEKHQPFEQDCVVVDVKDRSFDAIVLKTGSIVRIYQNSCEEGTSWKTESIATVNLPLKENEAQGSKPTNNSYEKKLLKLTITFPKTKEFPATTYVVETFTIVKVNLGRKQNSNKLEATLLRPVPSQVFTRQ